MEFASISLNPRFEIIFITPLCIRFQETIPDNIHTSYKKVITNAVDLFFRFAGQLRCRSSLDRMPHMSDFIQDERQIRSNIIPSALLKLIGKIMTPICSFQLHAVAEHGTESFQSFDSRKQIIRHAVQELFHRHLIIMV